MQKGGTGEGVGRARRVRGGKFLMSTPTGRFEGKREGGAGNCEAISSRLRAA